MKFPFADWFKIFKKTAATPLQPDKLNLKVIPDSLDEAILRLCLTLPSPAIGHIRFWGVEDTHFGIGLHLRNTWRLWDPESPLHKWFVANGIGHADDMSSIILTSLERHLKGRDIRLQEQIQYYRDFWLEEGIDPVTQEKCTPVCRKH